MMLQMIQSKDNPKIKHLRGLLEQSSLRKKHQQTVLEGAHLLDSYLQSGLPLDDITVITTDDGLQHPSHEAVLSQLDEMMPQFNLLMVTPAIYQSLTLLGHSAALMTIIPIPQHDKQHWQTQQDVLVLDNVQDPGNVGTLLRSAAAVGCNQVMTTTGTASLWSPKVLRAAMGAHFSLHLYEGIIPMVITQQFERVFATSSHEAASIYTCDLREPCAWVLGNEGQGVQSLLLESAKKVSIPQPGGQESLNVAIAGSICLFETMRQRLSAM